MVNGQYKGPSIQYRSARLSSRSHVTSFTSNWTMSTTVDVQQLDPIPIQQAPKPPKKLKPARKQVKAGDVVKTEAVQTGKEYSA